MQGAVMAVTIIHVMDWLTTDAFNACIALKWKSHKRQKKATVTLYCVVSSFLETYATNDVITKTDTEMMKFIRPTTEASVEYAKELKNKECRCNWVSNECVLKHSFIQRLSESICHSMHSYGGSKKNSTMSGLASNSTWLTRLQHDLHNTDAPCHTDRTDTQWKISRGRGRIANSDNQNSFLVDWIILQEFFDLPIMILSTEMRIR